MVVRRGRWEGGWSHPVYGSPVILVLLVLGWLVPKDVCEDRGGRASSAGNRERVSELTCWYDHSPCALALTLYTRN